MKMLAQDFQWRYKLKSRYFPLLFADFVEEYEPQDDLKLEKGERLKKNYR